MGRYFPTGRPAVRGWAAAAGCLPPRRCWPGWLAGRTSEASLREGEQVLRQSITSAAAACYALEGRYPENLQYLIDHYGIRVDTDTYIVSYMAWGENLLPDVQVFARGS